MKNISICYEILQYGFFDTSVKFPEKTVTPDRRLTCFEIELFTADQPGSAFINGKEYPLTAGTLICGKPGHLRHSRLNFKCCYLHLVSKSEALDKMLFSLPDVKTVTCAEALRAVFEKMAATECENVSTALYLHCCVDKILYILSGLINSRYSVSGGAVPHTAELQMIKKYIDLNFREKLSLETLAKRAALSPVYFHKLFTVCFGTSPAEYISALRLTAAKQALIATDSSIADIAFDCGFSSQSYFNYKFKSEVGVSPLKYRKDMLSRIEI